MNPNKPTCRKKPSKQNKKSLYRNRDSSAGNLQQCSSNHQHDEAKSNVSRFEVFMDSMHCNKEETLNNPDKEIKNDVRSNVESSMKKTKKPYRNKKHLNAEQKYKFPVPSQDNNNPLLVTASGGNQLIGQLILTPLDGNSFDNRSLNMFTAVICETIEKDTGILLEKTEIEAAHEGVSFLLFARNNPTGKQIDQACAVPLKFKLPTLRAQLQTITERSYKNNKELEDHSHEESYIEKKYAISEIEKFWNECLKKNQSDTDQLKTSFQAVVDHMKFEDQVGQGGLSHYLLKAEKNLRAEENNLREKIQLKEMEATEFSKVCQGFYDEVSALDLDRKEFAKLLSNIKQRFAAEISTFNQSMPIYAYRSAIKTSVKQNDVTILVAETGSGKSTQVAKYMLQNETKGLIACTQPRKLAARSLAEYVSLSYGGHVGGLVGYDFGFNKRITKDKTKIIYTTDYFLLQEWGKDPTLSKYEYVIVDEAHERSLATDLLLSVLRLTLERKNREVPLKIVITSATIDPTLFRKYFSQLKVSVLDVPGNIYPITSSWDQLPINLSKNYLNRAISKVKEVVSIHLTEEKKFGAMLVFVATPADTERAQRTLENEPSFKGNNIVILQLHRKLPLEDQQKIFKPTPGKQYVIFTTNIAETSVTVPDVTIVIESGAVKERQYDAKKNVSILKVVNVNQSSSTQRKGRAGRRAPGTCYFLYTKEDFDSFSSDMVPEIKRLPLDLCLLELFKLGVVNPHQFTFMDPPLPDAIENSLQALLYLEAIEINEENSYTLTDLGKKMSQFSIDPRLSKLLILAIQSGSADVSTALALSAMVSNGGNIFFRQGTNEEKQAADVRKLNFTDDNSDFLTMINVFYEWINCSKSDKVRSKWCRDNSINGKSMKTILSSISEYQQILKQLFPGCPTFSFESRVTENDSNVMNLITKCYGRNIVAYLGHPDLGYMTMDGDVLNVHPSSSISTFGSQFTKYLIYDSVLTTSRSFMLHVSCVSEDNDVVEEFHKSRGGALYTYALVSCWRFGPIGSLSFRRCFIGKKFRLLNDLEKELKNTIQLMQLSHNEFTSYVKLEADFNNFTLNVWCSCLFHDILFQIMTSKVSLYRNELKEETWKVEIDSSKSCVMLGRGGSIIEPYLSGDFNEIKIKEPYDSTALRKLMEENSQDFKEIVDPHKGPFRLVFNKPSQACDALSLLQSKACDVQLKTEQITFETESIKSTCKADATIFLEYTRRGRSGIGFVEFESELEASLCVSSGILSRFSAKLKNDNPKTLYLRNVSQDTTEDTLKDEISKQFVNFKVTLPYVKAFETTNCEKEQIVANIRNYMRRASVCDSTYTVTLCPFQEKSTYLKLALYFQSTELGCKAEKALRTIDLTVYDGTKTYTLHKMILKIKSRLSCSEYLYSKISEEIKEICEGIEYNVTAKKERCYICLSSSNLTLISAKYDDLQEMLNGETIDHPNMKLFFNECNWNKLCKIQTSVKVFIKHSPSINSPGLSIFGRKPAIAATKAFLFNLVNGILNQDIKHHVVFLNDPFKPKGILKKLIREYGSNLVTLRNMDGLTNVNLVLGRKQKLEISGAKEAVEKVEYQIDTLIGLLEAERKHFNEEEECGICFTEPEKDEKYRFELCGHLVCNLCFKSQLSATKLPLMCPKEDCAEELCVQDYKSLLEGNESYRDRKKLVEMAIGEFLSQPRTRYFNCPTPDCVNLLRKAKDGVHNKEAYHCCSDCDKEICTRCCTLSHVMYTCDDFKMLNYGERDSLELWIRQDTNSRKLCTSCGIGIEKISGCNHMTCSKCHSHLCWRCMRVFPTGMDVYDHQPYCEVVY